MGQPSARHQVDDAQLVGGPGHPVGHEGSALLVGDQDGPNPTGARQGVVQLNVVRARDPEGERNAFVLQGADNNLTSSHFHRLAISSRSFSATRSASAMMVRYGLISTD